jgi:CMD domain protein
MTLDIIDRLAGIRPGSPLDAVRAERVVARDNAQASYLALFAPASFGGVSAVERYAVAVFVTALHGAGSADAADHYRSELAAAGAPDELVAAVLAAAAAGPTSGPYGAYPPGPLSVEDATGPEFTLPADLAAAVGDRLAAAFAHAHLLVFRPRDAAPAALAALADAGWSVDDVVTLSQEVAFLTFQLRVVSGLRVLAAVPAAPTPLSGDATRSLS